MTQDLKHPDVINVPDRNGNTQLLRAVKSGNKEECQDLLKKGADPNIENKSEKFFIYFYSFLE